MRNTPEVRECVRHAAILAGGQSSRMGREKALLELDGEPLIRRTARVLAPLFDQIVVVTGKPEVAQAAQIPSISDSFPNQGPLGGIHAALTHFQRPIFVVACDLPFLNPDFIQFLCAQWNGEDALVPMSQNGAEPLHAVYAPSCVAHFESVLKAEGKVPSLRRVLSELNAEALEIEFAAQFGVRFENWNSPDDVVS